MKRSPLSRRTPLRTRTTRTAREARERARILARLQEVRGPWCQAPQYGIPCTAVATDGHEPLTRARGGSITDPSNIVLLCRQCHRRTHENPAWAVEVGLLVPSWKATP